MLNFFFQEIIILIKLKNIHFELIQAFNKKKTKQRIKQERIEILNIKIEPESNINTTMLFNSSQMQLIEDTPTPTRDSTSIKKRFFSQTFIVMFLLFTINLIKFMDRFTIAGTYLNYIF